MIAYQMSHDLQTNLSVSKSFWLLRLAYTLLSSFYEMLFCLFIQSTLQNTLILFAANNFHTNKNSFKETHNIFTQLYMGASDQEFFNFFTASGLFMDLVDVPCRWLATVNSLMIRFIKETILIFI